MRFKINHSADRTVSRIEPHLRATYPGTKMQDEVKEIVTVDDKLDVYNGRKYF
jgi:hypothetical protein